jgi:hypothetical protein
LQRPIRASLPVAMRSHFLYSVTILRH